MSFAWYSQLIFSKTVETKKHDTKQTKIQHLQNKSKNKTQTVRHPFHGRLQMAGNETEKQQKQQQQNCCMVVWCTQNLRPDGSSFTWHQPCNNQIALSFLDVKKQQQPGYKKATVTHSESHATWAQWVCLRTENSAILKAINNNNNNNSKIKCSKIYDNATMPPLACTANIQRSALFRDIWTRLNTISISCSLGHSRSACTCFPKAASDPTSAGALTPLLPTPWDNRNGWPGVKHQITYFPFTTQACKKPDAPQNQYILRSYNTPAFSAKRFNENPFTYQCDKEKKKADGFQIFWQFLLIVFKWPRISS